MKEVMNASEAREKSRKAKEINTEDAIQELIKDVGVAINLGYFETKKIFSYPINIIPIKEYFSKNGYSVEVGYRNSGETSETSVTITWY